MKAAITATDLKVNIHDFKHNLCFLVMHNSSYLVLCITLCAVVNTGSARRAVFVPDCQPMALKCCSFQHEILGQTPPELASMMFPSLLCLVAPSHFFLSSFWVALIKEPLSHFPNVILCWSASVRQSCAL